MRFLWQWWVCVICIGVVPATLIADEVTDLGVSTQRLAAIERVVQQGIDRGEMPGAVVLVKYKGRNIYHRAFGMRQVEPQPESMTLDTVFDLASLTKPVATASCIHMLLEEGRIGLDDPIAKWIPEFGQNGKSEVTVRHLLVHQGGLIPDNSIADYDSGRGVSFQRIHELSLRSPPGENFAYSDVGFLVLGELVEKVTGESLNVYAERRVFAPLKMNDTGYTPGEELVSRIAPTEKREGNWIRGDVHDPRAFLLDGVAGHAGLFSTAADLGRYGQMLVQHGEFDGQRIFSKTTVEHIFAPQEVSSGLRSLGWDKDSPYSSNRGDLLSPSAIGHGGFTGTAMWIDPEQELVLVFLSSRLHPDGKGSVNSLIGRVFTLAAAALPSPTEASPSKSVD
ncbi:MAG: serine hydrolase domain-containing protein [Planctomycetaceae bacterium]